MIDAGKTAALDTVGCLVADYAMQWRCRGAVAVYGLWRDAVVTGVPLAGKDRDTVTAFVEHAFGLPEKPRSEVHRAGWLAEFVWFITAEKVGTSSTRVLRRLEGPDFHATKPGGDGLAIWETDSGQLEFRLWESKHHMGKRGVHTSVTTATKQLKRNARVYLAQVTSIAAAAGAESGDDVRRLYGELVQLWLSESPRSGIGISITTSQRSIPKRCFTRVQASFPGLVRTGQLEGLVSGIGDFDVFTDDVRDRIWTAL